MRDVITGLGYAALYVCMSAAAWIMLETIGR